MPPSSKFQPATRRKVRLRMAMDGPAGSGKSYTVDRFAFALAGHIRENGGAGRVAIIDSENGSASLYKGLAPDGIPFDFDVAELTSYAPTSYTSLIEDAGRSGYDVLIIDSLSHAWAGKDGALEIKDKAGDNNSYTAWRTVTPLHNAMVEAILTSPCHVFVTLRSKSDHVLVTNDKGKLEPKRVGMAPIQRAGMEYEFTVYGSMDWNHVLSVSKSRCPAIENYQGIKPGADFMRPLIEWMETGESAVSLAMPSPLIRDEQLAEILTLIRGAGRNMDAVHKDLVRRFSVQELGELKVAQADEYAAWLAKQVEMTRGSARRQAAVPATPPAASTPPRSPMPPPSQAVPSPTGNGHASAPTGCATDAQLARLVELRKQLGIPDDGWKAILSKRNVDTARKLTVTQADGLILALANRIATTQLEAGMLGTDVDTAPTPTPTPTPKQEQAAPPSAAEKRSNAAPPSAGAA